MSICVDQRQATTTNGDNLLRIFSRNGAHLMGAAGSWNLDDPSGDQGMSSRAVTDSVALNEPVTHSHPLHPFTKTVFRNGKPVWRAHREPVDWYYGPSCEIYIGNALHKDKGVFAGQDIEKGDLIEWAPVLIFSSENGVYEEVDGYVYENGEDEYWLAMGYASFYNHSNDASASYECAYDEKENPGVEIVAVRDIYAGEEILINYNGYPDCKTPWEFD